MPFLSALVAVLILQSRLRVSMICLKLFFCLWDNLLSNFGLYSLVCSILNKSKNPQLLRSSGIFNSQISKIVLLSLTLCDRLEFSF